MTPKDAFDVLVTVLGREPGNRVIESTYDDHNFGNFFISYTHQEIEHSVVCDRGELALCDGLLGTKNCRTIFPALRSVDEQMILGRLGLS